MKLTNSWMASPEFVAQAAHALAGYAAIMTAWAFWPAHVMLTFLLFGAYAAVKEFWFDATYEIPKQGFGDNFVDFVFYCLGISIGFFLINL